MPKRQGVSKANIYESSDQRRQLFPSSKTLTWEPAWYIREMGQGINMVGMEYTKRRVARNKIIKI